MWSSQYLTNLIEQDHRAIKRRCASTGGFKSFGSAAITLAGIELSHRVRKRQFLRRSSVAALAFPFRMEESEIVPSGVARERSNPA